MFARAIGEGVELRSLEAGDAQELHALIEANREHLARWLPWVKPGRTLDDTKSFIAGTVLEEGRTGGIAAGILVARSLAGVCHLRADPLRRFGDVGYWLAAEHEGKGLMTRAAAALLDHAFDELGLGKIEIHCAPGNVKSRAIPERLGFTLEGVLRAREWLHDHFEDHVVYGILAQEWRARRG